MPIQTTSAFFTVPSTFSVSDDASCAAQSEWRELSTAVLHGSE